MDENIYRREARLLYQLAQASDQESAVGRIGLALARFTRDRVLEAAPVIEAEVYLACYEMAVKHGATALAEEIWRVQRLASAQVTECTEEDMLA